MKTFFGIIVGVGFFSLARSILVELCFLLARKRSMSWSIDEINGKIHLNICGDEWPPGWPDFSALLAEYGRIDQVQIKKSSAAQLPALPSEVHSLWIGDYPHLHALPALPANIQDLHLVRLPSLVELPLFTHVRTLSLVECAFADLRALPSLCHLRELSIIDCPFVELNTLPANLHTLRLISCNQLQDMVLPAHLNNLQCHSLPLIMDLWSFPEEIKYLELYNCPHLRVLTAWPEKLVCLTIMSCPNIPYPPHLPSTVHTFKYLRSGPVQVGDLPAGLEFLHLSHLQNIPSWPAGLNSLTLHHSHVVHDITLANLPATVSYLHLVNCQGVTQLDHLPAALHDLKIEDMRAFDSLTNLSSELDCLIVKDCRLRDLQWPDKLTCLELWSTDLPSMPTMPPGLQTLVIKDCRMTPTQLVLPESVNYLKLYRIPVTFTRVPAQMQVMKLKHLDMEELPNMGRATQLNYLLICGLKRLKKMPYLPPNPELELDVRKCPLLDDFNLLGYRQLQEACYKLNIFRLRGLFYKAFPRWRARRWAGVHVDINFRPGSGVEWEKMKEEINGLSGLKLEP